MPVVIVCEGLASAYSSGDPLVGQFLLSYDPEAHGGLGDAEFTADLEKARRFADAAEAIECWRAVPNAKPVRPDGRPNRPLTAFSVTLREVPE